MAGPWSRSEVEATVADYFRMFELELAGQRYNKTEHRNRLLPLLDNRTAAAVELKHQNISAVLDELGWHFISGYKPARNYQSLLFDVVADRIQRTPQLDDLEVAAAEFPAVTPAIADFRNAMVDAPKIRTASDAADESSRTFSACKRDYVAREARNNSLGKPGETFVVEYERWRLIQSGRDTLADKVEHVAHTRGDGLGFDVLSFEGDGRERFIEVKTTAFARETPFFITATELARSKADATQYFLYRLFEFRAAPKIFSLKGPVERHCILDPLTFRGRFS